MVLFFADVMLRFTKRKLRKVGRLQQNCEPRRPGVGRYDPDTHPMYKSDKIPTKS